MTDLHASPAHRKRFKPMPPGVSTGVVLACCFFPLTLWGDDSNKNLSQLIESACLDCHGQGSETGLDLESLGNDLSDDDTFRSWERVFDRVRSGEMPPQTEPRPDPRLVESALAPLEIDFDRRASRVRRASGV